MNVSMFKTYSEQSVDNLVHGYNDSKSECYLLYLLEATHLMHPSTAKRVPDLCYLEQLTKFRDALALQQTPPNNSAVMVAHRLLSSAMPKCSFFFGSVSWSVDPTKVTVAAIDLWSVTKTENAYGLKLSDLQAGSEGRREVLTILLASQWLSVTSAQFYLKYRSDEPADLTRQKKHFIQSIHYNAVARQ